MTILQFLVLATTGVYIIYKDFKEHIIPNKINLLLVIAGIIITVMDYSNFLSHLLGFAVLGMAMLLLAVVTKGFGMGDVKYIFVVGLILGLQQGGYALLIGFMLGGLISGILLLLKKVSKKDRIAFGPYLVLGALLSFFI